jgi:hypothetical protein
MDNYDISKDDVYTSLEWGYSYCDNQYTCPRCQCYGVHSFECSSITCNEPVPNFLFSFNSLLINFQLSFSSLLVEF